MTETPYRACPKCGSDDVMVDQFRAKERDRWTVGCMSCDWNTATFETQEQACEAWQTQSCWPAP